MRFWPGILASEHLDLPERLTAAYRSLPDEEQRVLELLSAIHRPVTREKALKYVRKAALVDADGQAFTEHRWGNAVRRLISGGLVVRFDDGIACHLVIANIVSCAADRKGRLALWSELLDEAEAELAPSYFKFWTYYYYSPQDFYEALRHAAYLNRADRFTDALEGMRRSYSYRTGEAELFLRLFCAPLDVEWLASRDPSIRDEAVASLAEYAHKSLQPADGFAGILRGAYPGDDVPINAGRVLVRDALLRGDLDEARQSIENLDISKAADRALYSGWESCIRGQLGRAVGLFEVALRELRTETGKRNCSLGIEESAFFVLALLGLHETKHTVRARKYLNAIHKSLHGFQLLRDALVAATDAGEGKRNLHRFYGGSKKLAGRPFLRRLLAGTLMALTNKKAARTCLPDLDEMRDTAESNGYAWVAAEFSMLDARLDSNEEMADSARAAHQLLGTAPLLDAQPEEQSWQRGLRGLALIPDKVGTSTFGTSLTSRLTWRVHVARAKWSVQAYEQRLGKNGKWTKGRVVSLTRLHTRTNLAFATQQDALVCGAVGPAATEGQGKRLRMEALEALDRLVGHPLVFRKDAPQTRLDVVRVDPDLRVTTHGGKVRIKLVPPPPASGNLVAKLDAPTRVTVTVFSPSHWAIVDVIGRKGLATPAGSKDEVVHALSSVSALVTVHSDIGGGDVGAVDMDADPRPQFHLTPLGEGLYAEALVRPFGKEGPTYPPGRGAGVVFSTVNGSKSRARRNRSRERHRYRDALASCMTLHGAERSGNGWELPEPLQCLELLDELHALGDSVVVAWPKGEAMGIRHRASASGLSLKIRDEGDWFGIEGNVRLDSGRVMDLREMLDRIAAAESRFLPLSEGGFIALTRRFRRHARELAAFVDQDRKGLRLDAIRAPAMEAILEDAGQVDADTSWNQRLKQFRDAQALEPSVPSTLRADLRDYQRKGFEWAARLAAWGAGACLADDMGLGKTLQSLTVALASAPDGPTLVVAPTSVCPNWIDEARRFTPTMRPVQFGHGDRQKMLDDAGPFDLVVCSYGLLQREADRLAAVEWEMVVLDEAQAIKNRQTLRSRAAMKLPGAFRMITTGTPIENHLGELWNLFQFINPGLLGSSKSFNTKFASPIQTHSSDSARRQLKRLIRPFILRRTKSAVLDELPARTEITVRVEMSRREMEFYEAVRQQAVERMEHLDTVDGRSHLHILAEIMRLRRACCHPRLLAPESAIPGSKLDAFSEIVEGLLENGHKALVFSQFVGHLGIVRNRLDEQGVSYRYLDGSTPARKRKSEIDAFQAGDGDLFLISLRAGGQGLNLTAADYVLHLDPWWNPAVEDQASDRAHRIGQTRPVTIYRLVMKDTIEEKIVDLHGAKRDLADSLLEGADISGKMSSEELLALMRQA